MRSLLAESHRKGRTSSLWLMSLSLLFAGSLVAAPGLSVAGSGDHSPSGHATPVAMPGWTQQLKGQTIVENAIEGRADNAQKMEQQHHRLMEKLERQAQTDATGQRTSGMFNDMSMMHQYMGQDGSSFLLMTDSGKGEPVLTTGGKCPANAPLKKYDVSMINIEITLNRWLDFYPGYMYVNTEDLDKARGEEAKNRAARDLDGFDPGAVTTGLQGDVIQPLVLRANQGDCVKMTLRNQMESEDGSLFIQASSMIVSATGKPATTTNPDSIVPPGKSQEFEWYIHPQMQEGVRQFHSFSHDRELTVLGLFGAFIVEPKGSKYLDSIGTGPDKEVRSGWQVNIDRCEASEGDPLGPSQIILVKKCGLCASGRTSFVRLTAHEMGRSRPILHSAVDTQILFSIQPFRHLSNFMGRSCPISMEADKLSTRNHTNSERKWITIKRNRTC